MQVPLLIKLAKKRGNAAHAGPGENIWSNVHIDDLVTLYALAIEKAPAGSFYFAENGENSMREACVAINRMLGFAGPPAAMSMAGGRRRMGRGHDGRYHGLQQPGARQARAAARLEAERAWADRGDRAGVLSGVKASPSSLRTQGPIRRGDRFGTKLVESASRKQRAVVMGPCVRRDDAGWSASRVALRTPSHHAHVPDISL